MGVLEKSRNKQIDMSYKIELDRVRYLASEPEVGNLILHHTSQKSQPVCLEQVAGSRVPPKEENDKPLLSTLYLENPGKSHCKSVLI